MNLYNGVYAPLYSELSTIALTISGGAAASKLRDRVADAWADFRIIKRRRGAWKAAWKTLFDKKTFEETSDIEWGGKFPIIEIDRHLHIIDHAAPYKGDHALVTTSSINNLLNTRKQRRKGRYDDTPWRISENFVERIVNDTL